MRTTMLALSMAAMTALAACSGADETTTGSVDADPAADPNAVVIDPVAPASPDAPPPPPATQ